MTSASKLLPWNRRYALSSYLSGAIWPVPLLALIVYQFFNISVQAVNNWLVRIGMLDEHTAFLALTPDGARAMLGTVVTANLSFLVFTFSSLLVAIQVAGGQYTPRIIATTLLRDNVIRFTVGSFVFTIGFTQRVLSRIDDTVHQLDTFIGAVLGMLSVMVFLFLIDYAARLLRPVSIVARVGQFGIGVVRAVYPTPTTRTRPADPPLELGSPPRIVGHEGTSGVVLAVDLRGLIKMARNAKGVIEFVPLVGDFIAVDEPLFKLYGAARTIEAGALRATVALGTERTIGQDPTFAFRILVDIAIKALSAAINDPTSAVMAIDQLHRLLRLIGQRDLRGERFFDESGQLRLLFRTPNWEDFVHLSCVEIRHCGAGSIQVVRRMRAMLENLMKTLPPHRHAELRQQLELLDRTVDESFALAEDRVLARIADSQGLGGALGLEPAQDHTAEVS